MKRLAEKAGLAVLQSMDPERAHGLALAALNAGLAGQPGPIKSDRLRVRLAGMDLANPVGLAAGFDKNAQAVGPLGKAGFGFIEVGAATPLPQPGNPKPRLFRLKQDAAAINRFGFNNDGMDAIAGRLAGAACAVPVGINLGANKTSEDRAADFAVVMQRFKGHVSFATVNVSSPNTEKLRDLQGPAALAALLDGVMQVRGNTPVFLKIAPDLTLPEISDIATVAQNAGVDGIIATNTTLDRDGLHGPHKTQAGGLSGQPLFEKSTRVLAQLSAATDLPLIGVGGVASGAQAYAKIRAGATAVQLYTGLVYGGLSLVGDIIRDLGDLLERDGFASVAEACGTDRDRWLNAA
ncbi:quinone-dependent dihydroorotate dehydrogenase [Roseobacter denitrificans]|uniref:Dihydroorotate dehydrogenase (quinone) n=1 Tax=Roseobacter denitrificans (strain ATCC 33942 / OCh 114) TaxID=375451 RepID=Q161C8_ROSDO|nr:quinone-dependent dihydroorotate dehydrogenase [Roseobacter denitrificans]ABG33415.1 dihydroorotate oxidase, putative [Roseobacter denitrificans OCh 114]AVL52735.1 quinone-dependent dihydroorotate dehydrogenase [Roseobacter denitrificans]SFG24143.1 dihydroorotate oxidase A [Roseobacter denitrificans OCh 114]